MLFAGIDVHIKSFVLSVIDENLNIMKVKSTSLEELITEITIYKPEIIAVDAPYNLNFGLMNDDNYRLGLDSKIKGHFNKKVSEYELSKRGINPFSTPDSVEKIAAKSFLGWMVTGFRLYKRLEDNGFKLGKEENWNEKSKLFIEVFPHASFAASAAEALNNIVDTEKAAHISCESSLEYDYNNIDSGIWLKHFYPVNNCIDISMVLDLKNNPDECI